MMQTGPWGDSESTGQYSCTVLLVLNAKIWTKWRCFKYKAVSLSGLHSYHGWVSSGGHPSKECPTSSSSADLNWWQVVLSWLSLWVTKAMSLLKCFLHLGSLDSYFLTKTKNKPTFTKSSVLMSVVAVVWKSELLSSKLLMAAFSLEPLVL